MSHKTRKAYTAEEKVAILRRHLLEQTPVSDLCDQYQLHPTQFYRWQRQFFETGAAVTERVEGVKAAAPFSKNWRCQR